MKRKLAVFLCTVFVFMFIGEFRFQVPSMLRLGVAGIIIAAGMVCLHIDQREKETTGH